MGSRRLETLADISSAKYRLRADCLRCKRVVILDPIPLTLRCHAKGWSYRLEDVCARMVCAQCGSQKVSLGPVFGDCR